MTNDQELRERIMQEAKHTPGPWHRDDLLPPNGRPVIARTIGGIPISATTDDWLGSDGEDEANAALIAAAPELLEALEDALKYAEFERHPFRPWHDKARQAIAKARAA